MKLILKGPYRAVDKVRINVTCQKRLLGSRLPSSKEYKKAKSRQVRAKPKGWNCLAPPLTLQTDRL